MSNKSNIINFKKTYKYKIDFINWENYSIVVTAMNEEAAHDYVNSLDLTTTIPDKVLFEVTKVEKI